jgi:hypothetical protein
LIWQKSAAAVFVLLTIALLHPIDQGIGQMRETKASWVAVPDDFEKSLTWISANTPNDSVILASPNSRKFWYLSKRAQVVSYSYPRYDRLGEWFTRIGELTANAHIPDRASSRETIDTAFNDLTTAQITALKEKHAATHLVTRAVYPFPVIFETGTYKIYRLP